MKQYGTWSRRSSSNDTMTSDTLTNFLNMSTSSPRSSNTSLPFAEDAIRQNQDEWEHIERIFYGEEPLPEDEKTREEFQDWMETFPYLRVVGRRVNTERFRTTRNPIYHEEVIAVDPPNPSSMTRRDGQDTVRHSNGSKVSLMVGSRSGQALSRRYDCGDGEDLRHHRGGDLPSGPNRSTVTSKKDLLVRPGGLASNSANLFRLPTINALSINSSTSKWPSSGSSSGGKTTAARPSPLKSTLTLPMLNVDQLITFGDLLTTRSISALYSQPGEEQRKIKRGSKTVQRYK